MIYLSKQKDLYAYYIFTVAFFATAYSNADEMVLTQGRATTDIENLYECVDRYRKSGIGLFIDKSEKRWIVPAPVAFSKARKARPSKIDYPNAWHHLMVQTPDANLSQCMRLLNGVSTDPDIQEFEMQLYISGKWQNTEESMPVHNPFGGSVVDEVSIASPDEVEKAIVSAQRGALVMEEMHYWRRSKIIAKAACRFYLQIYNG